MREAQVSSKSPNCRGCLYAIRKSRIRDVRRMHSLKIPARVQTAYSINLFDVLNYITHV